MTVIFQLIREWAQERGIFKNGDVKTQTLKLQEEVGELAKAVINNDEAEVIDAIGDCVVVLTNVAKLASIHFSNEQITIENCIESAYDEIKNRKGKMENGSFIKEK